MISKDLETAIQQLEDDGHFGLAMSVKSTIEQLQKEVERFKGFIHRLDSYIDLSELVQSGEMGIQNPSGINELFEEMHKAINGESYDPL